MIPRGLGWSFLRLYGVLLGSVAIPFAGVFASISALAVVVWFGSASLVLAVLALRLSFRVRAETWDIPNEDDRLGRLGELLRWCGYRAIVWSGPTGFAAPRWAFLSPVVLVEIRRGDGAPSLRLVGPAQSIRAMRARVGRGGWPAPRVRASTQQWSPRARMFVFVVALASFGFAVSAAVHLVPRATTARYVAQCERGDTNACVFAAIRHEHGQGVRVDPVRADHFWARACAQGLAGACLRRPHSSVTSAP